MTRFTSRIAEATHDRPLGFALVGLVAATAIHFAEGCSGASSATIAGSSISGSDSVAVSGAASGAGSGAASGASSGAASGAGSGAASGASSGAASGASSGTASGATSGASSGGMSGAPSGASSGGMSGTASGATSGATSGAASGAASGAMSGATTGSASGSAGNSGSLSGGGGVCSSACVNAKGCPSQSCYVPKASQIGNPTDSTMCSSITQMPTRWQPQYAVDGNLATRYTTCGAGVGTEWFEVDMCRVALVHGVTLAESPGDANDQAAAYNVQVSLDETNWTSVAMSSSVPPGTSVLTVKFAPVMARYVRFIQTGMVGVSNGDGSFVPKWWSIAEFNVTCGGP